MYDNLSLGIKVIKSLYFVGGGWDNPTRSPQSEETFIGVSLKNKTQNGTTNEIGTTHT